MKRTEQKPAKPKHSPVWWVVRVDHGDGFLSYLGMKREQCRPIFTWPDRSGAYPFTSLRDAWRQARLWRPDAKVRRVTRRKP